MMEDCSDPLMYLEQCHDYMASYPLTDDKLLASPPNVLYGTARDWWDVMRLEMRTRKEFECKFSSSLLSDEYTDEEKDTGSG